MDSLLKILKNAKSVCIVGKGAFNSLPEADVYVATKNCLCVLKDVTDKPKILQMNDFEGIFANETYLRDVSYIITPLTIHVEMKKSCMFEKFCDYCRTNGFTGEFIPFNLISKKTALHTKPDPRFPSLPTKSSGDIICHLMARYHIRHVRVFLCGVCGSPTCNPDIENAIKSCVVKDEPLRRMYCTYVTKKYSIDNPSTYYTERVTKWFEGFPKIFEYVKIK